MTEVETFAIAARLHVVIRRTLGRVTDVEWMTKNRDYALEVVRVAREADNAEMRDLATKFEVAMNSQNRCEPLPRRALATAQPAGDLVAAGLPAAPAEATANPDASRYVGRLR